jgi:DNA-binding transcriptional LysR family regulator
LQLPKSYISGALQIRRLEEEINVQLFHRTKRRVSLTQPGAIFLEKARLTLSHAGEAVASAQKASRGESGELAIGFVGSAAFEFLPEVLKKFRKSFPEVGLVLQELTTSQQLVALHRSQIRVGLLRPPISDAGIETETVARESWVIAIPRSHPLHGRSRVALQQFAADPFIGTPRALGPGLHDQALSLCLQSGFRPEVVQEAIQMATIVSLVAAGIGVALLPSSVERLGRKDILYKPLLGSPKVYIALAWRRGDRNSVFSNFVRITRETRTIRGWAKQS